VILSREVHALTGSEDDFFIAITVDIDELHAITMKVTASP
jgi:hypothetical protein